MNVKDEINYDDLPDKTIINEAVTLSNHIMKALLLFMVSTRVLKSGNLKFNNKRFYRCYKRIS